MYQATHLKEVQIRFLLTGITLNASLTDYRPIEQFIMHRFDGNQWEMLGDNAGQCGKLTDALLSSNFRTGRASPVLDRD
jgi:hypothetical protein